MRSFYRFILSLALAMAMVAVALLLPEADGVAVGLGCAWLVLLVGALGYVWNRDRVNELLTTLPCVAGAALFVLLQRTALQQVDPALAGSVLVWIGSVIGSAITAFVVYDTAFGHWFLETKGNVPIRHLVTGIKALWILLGLRLAWNLVQAFRLTAYVSGEPVGLPRYLVSLEGFLLAIGIVMGTVLPFVLMGFTYKTLKIGSTTSATGILYGTTLCVLMGDLAYRYYLLTYGIIL